MTKNNWIKEFVEKGAALEHDRWAKWQNYLHSKLDFSTGKYVLSESDFEHWNRQIHTPYAELSEKEKESDRIEVRKYLPLIQEILTQKDQEHKAELENIKGEIENAIAEPTELKDVKIYNIALQDAISILDSHINKISTE
jgi:hypothetical protein